MSQFQCFSDLSVRPLIMGILNVTPDSFYDGGKYHNEGLALERALIIAKEGGDIIDIGGESTRPGSSSVSAQEEMDRVCPIIESVVKETGLPVSIDTTKSSVAEQALSLGAVMVNDISGGLFDPEILNVTAKKKAFIVLTHTSGRPLDMQNNTFYKDIITELKQALELRLSAAIGNGIESSKIVIDPGIGFGKSLDDNYKIINKIPELKKIGYPVLIGLSRKSLIDKLYTKDEDSLSATIALNAVAIHAGADIIRVHDIKAHNLAMQALIKLREVS